MTAEGLRLSRRMRHGRETWHRHELVAGLLGGVRGSIIDVGGLPGRLAPLLDGCEITTANIEPPADVVFDGSRLPFADGAFEAATSIDVLEHIAPAGRQQHVHELLRVAARRVVLCCPLGMHGDDHSDAELADWFECMSGGREAYLDEHAANGLPLEAEVRTLVERAVGPGSWRAEVRFNGDRAAERELFRRETLAHHRRRPADRLRYAWWRLRTPVDDVLRDGTATAPNRVYVVCARSRWS